MMLAPIALFAFNRPVHLRSTLEFLAKNELAKESELTIFCDGPRHGSEKSKTDAVRNLAKTVVGFRDVSVVVRDCNLGCAKSVITGLNELFSHHQQVIVIEDDIVTSPYTLRFLNSCLKKYEEEKSVFNISAWSPPRSLMKIEKKYSYDAYFIPRFNCWGWATWRDRWEKVDWAVIDYKAFSKDIYLQRAFNQGGVDLTPMLHAQLEHRIDSWAIRMDYARFKHGCVGLNPVYSYTTNTGIGYGTHTFHPSTRFDNDTSMALATPGLPEHVFMNQTIVKAYREVYAPKILPVRVVNKGWRFLSRHAIRRNSE